MGRNQIALETCVKPDLRRVRSGDNPQKSITTSSHLCNSSSSLHNNFSAIDFVVLQLGIYIPVGLVFLGDARWQKNDFFYNKGVENDLVHSVGLLIFGLVRRFWNFL